MITNHKQAQLEGLRVALESDFEQHIAQLTALTRAASTHDLDDPTRTDELRLCRQRLADIANALQRMAEGVYGACERCAAGIPVDRLEILPQARHCIACQQAVENVAERVMRS